MSPEPLAAPAGPLEGHVAELRLQGCTVVHDVLAADDCARLRSGLRRAAEAEEREAGSAALGAASEAGNAMIRFLERDAAFLETLALPAVLAFVDAILGPDAVLRFQMGNRSPAAGARPTSPQSWHRNFVRPGSGRDVGLDLILLLDDVDATAGALVAAPGSQVEAELPPDREQRARVLAAPAGSMVVISSALWHRESPNTTDRERLGLVQQYVQAWVKPYFDYPRMLGEERLRALPERTRRLLGWDCRLPATAAEFHATGEARMWRAGTPR